jgi:hypothetical protein
MIGLGIRLPSRLTLLFDDDITAVRFDDRLELAALVARPQDEPARMLVYALIVTRRDLDDVVRALEAAALADKPPRRASLAWRVRLERLVHAAGDRLVVREAPLAGAVHGPILSPCARGVNDTRTPLHGPTLAFRVYAHAMRRGEHQQAQLRALVQGADWANMGQRDADAAPAEAASAPRSADWQAMRP